MRPGAAVMARPRRRMAVGCHRPRAQHGTSCCAVTGESSAVLRGGECFRLTGLAFFPRIPDDILKLLPKPRDSSTEEALNMVDEPILEEVLIVHVEAAALIAHITNDWSPLNATQFTTPKDYAHAVDPERTPDFRLWLEATRKEYELLDNEWGAGK